MGKQGKKSKKKSAAAPPSGGSAAAVSTTPALASPPARGAAAAVPPMSLRIPPPPPSSSSIQHLPCQISHIKTSPNGDEPLKKKNKRKPRRKKNSKKSRDEDEAFLDRQRSGSESKPAKTEVAMVPNTPPVNTSHADTSLKQSERKSYNTEKKRKLSKDITDVLSHKGGDGDASIPDEEEVRPPRYSFQVDDTDHCETPLQAYRDAINILDRLAKSLNKTRSTLTIYDPYYCDGGVKKKLASFGFTSVINRNRDFYQDIDNNLTPEYDVLVTNPPYSGVHMEKILAFCSDISKAPRKKPFLLLLPHFVYTKDYYQRALSPQVSSSVFFLVPEVRYGYIPPAWVEAKMGSKAIDRGKTITAPFPSFWYCHAPTEMIQPIWLVQNFGPSGMFRPKHHSRLRYAKCSQDIPRDFKGEFDTSKKRPNAKARKRAAKKRLSAR